MGESIIMATSVDEGEVQRHSDLKETWWSMKGDLRGLHIMNGVRIPFIAEELTQNGNKSGSRTLADKNILEVGCGGGIVTEALAKLGAKVTGVDPSPNLINLAREHSNLDPKVAANKPTYCNTTIEDHSKQFPAQYDAVVATEVVEHVADLDVFLESCVAAVKPGGKIFITSPNRTRIGQLLVMIFGVLIAIIPKQLMTYSKFRKPEEISEILKRNNCKVDKVKGIFYLPFIDQCFLVFFTSVWFALAATKQDNKK